MVDDANRVVTALARFKAARTALASAPVHLPLTNTERISSPFGNRKDPFTGRLAFHPGVDFPNPNGTTVMAAGAGVVSFVGQISGYGNAIEIDHGGGLITRYGHLSSFIAQKGDKVVAGTPIARVGSTGRSTGPHLHFEFRRNDVAIDPMQFINVGKRLKRFTSAIG
jgi:murein DD-endopeptidase MepM/ murein hydrolase activator NlpD